MTAESDPVAAMLETYRREPKEADASWGAVLDGLEGASLTTARPAADAPLDPLRTALVLGRLIEGYRWRGHAGAKLDPLGLARPVHDPEIELDRRVLATAAGDRVVPLAGALGLSAAGLRDILGRLESVYAGPIGWEFMHVPDPVAREWLRREIETGTALPEPAARLFAAERLIEADEFELFMGRRFVGKKRFGAEGAESLLPALWSVLVEGAAQGLRSVVIGGTSRARLNQLANFVGKPLLAIFAEVKGASPFPDGIAASGDVPYHLGSVTERDVDGASVRLEYCCNPSHLEAVNGVALGRVRALQEADLDPEAARRATMALLVHTDAAFAGQGVVSETFQLSGLAGYATGGTIHVVINNQLGFTTDPADGRTSPACTDVAKAVGAPVFHVNADDVDAVARVGRLAAAFRQRFGRDVVIDLVCFRRRGHNELDEPTFTQPLMYAAVERHPGARRLFLDRLIADGVLTPEDEAAMAESVRSRLEEGYAGAAGYRPNLAGGTAPAVAEKPEGETTGLSLDRLRAVGRAISSAPAGTVLHPKVERVFGERLAALDSREGVPWAFAEALAIGTVLADGRPVRMSGQDTPRGAFSQRHFVVHDRATGAPASIFAALAPPAASAAILPSPLAEYATLAFEYGYSLDRPEALVIWEAQFGDFANVAQPVFDQFILSGADKWLQLSGLVTLLPHGLEGQGAEHSSARIERFLQMAASDNVTLANVSTPANYFHLLRRQAAGPRRPLVVFTPKSLLRHRDAVSRLDEMGPGTAFRPVIGPEPGAAPRRLVLVSGKLFWEIEAERRRAGITEIGLVRVEQLYPFPAESLTAVLAGAPAAEIVWCQEEPENMGAWSFMAPRLAALAGPDRPVRYLGRPANPSPAMGTAERHAADQARIVASALDRAAAAE